MMTAEEILDASRVVYSCLEKDFKQQLQFIIDTDVGAAVYVMAKARVTGTYSAIMFSTVPDYIGNFEFDALSKKEADELHAMIIEALRKLPNTTLYKRLIMESKEEVS